MYFFSSLFSFFTKLSEDSDEFYEAIVVPWTYLPRFFLVEVVYGSCIMPQKSMYIFLSSWLASDKNSFFKMYFISRLFPYIGKKSCEE